MPNGRRDLPALICELLRAFGIDRRLLCAGRLRLAIPWPEAAGGTAFPIIVPALCQLYQLEQAAGIEPANP